MYPPNPTEVPSAPSLQPPQTGQPFHVACGLVGWGGCPPHLPLKPPARSPAPTPGPTEVPARSDRDLQLMAELSQSFAEINQYGSVRAALGNRERKNNMQRSARHDGQIADADIIPKRARKAAANCGGVAPGEGDDFPQAFGPGWLNWAEAGTEACRTLVQELLSVRASDCRLPPLSSRQGYVILTQLSRTSCADVVEAYLGATDASEKLNEHLRCPTVPWHRDWGDFVGGTFNDTDDIAEFINEGVKKYYEASTPRPRSKSLRRATSQ